jgi:hypothetical protein
VTGENLIRHRSTKFAHLSLKHISLIGVVRVKLKKKKKQKRLVSRRPKTRTSAAAFLFDEAAVAEDDDDDEDDEDDADDAEMAVDEDEDNGDNRGMSESEFDSDSEVEEEEEEEEEVVNDSGDLSEQLIAEAERNQVASTSTTTTTTTDLTTLELEHSYSCSSSISGAAYIPPQQERPDEKEEDQPAAGIATTNEWKKKAKYRYSFLYSMVSSGITKKIRNCIPKAVAILSNSKTIILGHVHFLLECLDPRLAELCYMDTDSCIFSFTHPLLEDNLLAEKKEIWLAGDIIADENGEKSCHGKLKLEGTFRVGFFKALKIYRLFSSREFAKEQKRKTCYTRCKGVNRNIAKIIPNSTFDRDAVDKVVVHRSCLRPSRTGEMLVAHECKSLAAPFNLKRRVHEDGIHTFPISYVPDIRGSEEEEEEEEEKNEERNDGSSQGSL